jgi:hypothetical protein
MNMSNRNDRSTSDDVYLGSLLGALRGASGRSTSREDSIDLTDTEIQAKLKEGFAALSAVVTFKPGDLVSYKPGLQNKSSFPGNVGIVTRILAEPVFDDSRTASGPYFREPLDVVVAEVIKGDNGILTLIEFHLDSRRLQIHSEASTKHHSGN